MEQLLICECGHPSHQLIFSTLGEEIVISMHLSQLPFRKRLVHAIKYLFGKDEAYGGFEEILTTKEKLTSVIERL
jgi:hypothetical protein